MLALTRGFGVLTLVWGASASFVSACGGDDFSQAGQGGASGSGGGVGASNRDSSSDNGGADGSGGSAGVTGSSGGGGKAGAAGAAGKGGAGGSGGNAGAGGTSSVEAGVRDAAPPVGRLVINEVDYNGPGTDTAEFVELFNNSNSAVELESMALVLINGAAPVNAEYSRIQLTGKLDPMSYLVIATPGVSVAAGAQRIAFAVTQDAIQNGDPDGLLLIHLPTLTILDALSYGGSVTAATISGTPRTFNLVEGSPLAAIDDGIGVGSLVRDPNGWDANNAATDWNFTVVPTPGALNDLQ